MTPPESVNHGPGTFVTMDHALSWTALNMQMKFANKVVFF